MQPEHKSNRETVFFRSRKDCERIGRPILIPSTCLGHNCGGWVTCQKMRNVHGSDVTRASRTFSWEKIWAADLKIIGPHFHLTRILTKVQLPKALNSKLHKDVPKTWVGLSCDKYCTSFVSCLSCGLKLMCTILPCQCLYTLRVWMTIEETKRKENYPKDAKVNPLFEIDYMIV